MYVCMYMCMYVCIYLRMANISNWNKTLWTPDIIYYNFLVIGKCYLSFITLQFTETFSFTFFLISFHQHLVFPSRFFLQDFPAHWHALETTACVILSNINLKIHRSWRINQFRHWHGIISQTIWIIINTSFRS